MAIGKRIHFFRTMRGIRQKYLGMLLGFPEKSANVRMAQYEMETSFPKAEITAALTQADKLRTGEINREEYDNRHYHYPKYDDIEIRASVPSQELSDTFG